MKRIFPFLLLLLLITSCKNIISEQAFAQFHLVQQTKGPTLGYNPQSGVTIIYHDNYAFKDLNRNQQLDTYEDWRLTPEQRAHDLAQQITIQQIAGLMLYSPHVVVNDSLPSPQIVSCLLQDQMRHILVTKVKNAYTAALWHNNLQAIAEAQPFGIPTNNSSDPRNYTEADGSSMLGRVEISHNGLERLVWRLPSIWILFADMPRLLLLNIEL